MQLGGEGLGTAGEEERERGEPRLNPVHSTQTTEEGLQQHNICVVERRCVCVCVCVCVCLTLVFDLLGGSDFQAIGTYEGK